MLTPVNCAHPVGVGVRQSARLVVGLSERCLELSRRPTSSVCRLRDGRQRRPDHGQRQNGRSCSDMLTHTCPVGLPMRLGCAALAPVCMYNPAPQHIWRYFHSPGRKNSVLRSTETTLPLWKTPQEFFLGSLDFINFPWYLR